MTRRRRGGELFFIHSGVRRALAAREAGLKTIKAVVFRDGHRPVARRVPLSRLYSPKAEVERDERFLSIRPPIIAAIEIEPLGLPGQHSSVPLFVVRLV